MTVFESSMSLWRWFSDHDYFSMEKDFKKIIPISDSEKKDTCSIRLALKSLEETGMISKSEDSEIWVLKRKLDESDQEVCITHSTALEISMIINTFVECLGSENFMQNYKCDPSCLKEQDIKSLCFVAQTMADKDSC